MIADFDTLAKLAGTRKVAAVAAWCARNRIMTFRDTKHRPCTTMAALDRALGRGKDAAQPNYAAIDEWGSSRAGSQSQASSRKTAAITKSSATNGSPSAVSTKG